jgi:hypothetical protein
LGKNQTDAICLFGFAAIATMPFGGRSSSEHRQECLCH